MEVDELAQHIRLKLWRALQEKRTIVNPKAYITACAYTGAIDLFRYRKPVLPLPVDEDGELYQGELYVGQSEELQDPARIVEKEELISEYIVRIARATLGLPPRQRFAMICMLKDILDDIVPLIDAFKVHAINIEEIHWPGKKEDVHTLKVSLSLARKKMRSLFEIDTL